MSEGRGFDDGDRGAGRESVPPARGVVSAVDLVFAELVRDLPVVQFAPPVRAEDLTEAGGPDLARLLSRLEAADADHFTVGEAIRACERLMSWAAGVQADLVNELTMRAGSQAEWVRDEVAALLRLSGRAADVVTDRASAVAVTPELGDALKAGVLDTRRVDAAVRATNHLGNAATREVVREVLPKAPDLTAPQLRDAIRRVDITRDPGGTEKRHAAAKAERCVRLEVAPEAMAWIHAFLPADDAMAVWQAVDALAHTTEPGEDRTLAQRRADALTGVMRRVLDTGATPDGTPLAKAHGTRPHLSVIANPDLLVPGALGTATLEGYGPIPASVAREVAAGADWRAIGADPLTGEATGVSSSCYRPSERLAAALAARDQTCTYPGCRRPAIRCDIDHLIPYDPTRPAAAQTCWVNLHALCRRHHRLKTHGRWDVERDPDTGVTTWTSPDGRVHTRDPVPVDPDVPKRARRPRDEQAPLDPDHEPHDVDLPTRRRRLMIEFDPDAPGTPRHDDPGAGSPDRWVDPEVPPPF